MEESSLADLDVHARDLRECSNFSPDPSYSLLELDVLPVYMQSDEKFRV
jgi:hypothetical protein